MPRVCKWGHALEGDNIHVRPDGKSICRACQKRRVQEFKDRHGLPNRDRCGRPSNTVDVVLSRLISDGRGCLVWPRGCSSSGYGMVLMDKKLRPVHRVIYEAIIGPVPEGLVLHHECRNRRCANPAHLEVCGVMENTLKDHPDLFGKAGRNKTHCKHGHPFSGENLRMTPDGRRSCRMCARMKNRVQSARRKAERANAKAN